MEHVLSHDNLELIHSYGLCQKVNHACISSLLLRALLLVCRMRYYLYFHRLWRLLLTIFIFDAEVALYCDVFGAVVLTYARLARILLSKLAATIKLAPLLPIVIVD